MRTSRELGIRYETDLVDDGCGTLYYLISSLNIIADVLEPQGKRFFFDTMDASQFTFGGEKCQDMLGWVVDDADVPSFEPRWLAGEDCDELDEFEYVFVNWAQGDDGRPAPEFDVCPEFD